MNRTNLLSLSLTPEALEPEIVLGLDLALELDRALRLVNIKKFFQTKGSPTLNLI